VSSLADGDTGDIRMGRDTASHPTPKVVPNIS